MDYGQIVEHKDSQEVRLPKKFRMKGDKVKISPYGWGVLLEPIESGFTDLIESLSMFSDDFMQDGRNQPLMQEREPLWY